MGSERRCEVVYLYIRGPISAVGEALPFFGVAWLAADESYIFNVIRMSVADWLRAFRTDIALSLLRLHPTVFTLMDPQAPTSSNF